MATLREAARRRLNLDPLTTSLTPPQHPSQHQTPTSSALSAASLSAPFGYNPSSFTPVSAVRNSSYNPAQWSNSPNLTPDSSSRFSSGHSSARPQAPEAATPPPPPPYSPPRSQRTSMIVSEEASTRISPATRLSSATLYRSSPEPASDPIFPPPPNTRARAASNDRPLSLFNIASFSRRTTTPESQRLSPETIRDHGSNPRRPVPVSIEAPPSASEEEGSGYKHTVILAFTWLISVKMGAWYAIASSPARTTSSFVKVTKHDWNGSGSLAIDEEARSLVDTGSGAPNSSRLGGWGSCRKRKVSKSWTVYRYVKCWLKYCPRVQLRIKFLRLSQSSCRERREEHPGKKD
ncbi:uncharacterized protein L3040_004334 [Drepanopeziza brunnea f. sp. 'multigermtubi']|uniref:uncharacterized protein n=1 Tax=Drepanopeziza brunnea f. sp. 'multigermtubi' TaxID=698441 RepID=UPI00238531CF|nr:hypothetical protein L3040_004334 [Drepanopeziza brunnea f. sp. 'multigermtubi']